MVITKMSVGRPVLIFAAVAWLVLLVLAYDQSYRAHPRTPSSLDQQASWRNWWDQSKYLQSATALAAGDLSSAQHWYPLGYPLLAAPFVSASPLDPFYPANLASFLVLSAALMALGSRLGLGLIAGIAALAIGVMWPAELLSQYLVPWTTTPVAALYVTVLAIYVKSIDARLSTARSVALGAVAALIAAIRPVDSIALIPVFAHLAWSEWRHRGTGSDESPATPTRILLAGLVTGGAVLGAYAALHLSIHGVRSGVYLDSVGENLLRPDLIPLRFLLLFNNPREIYGDGVGLLERYPALVLGLMGLAYCAVFSRHRGVPLTVLASLGVYLSFVDFVPTNLWRYGSIHYLKWMFPVLVLLTLSAIKDVAKRKDWRRSLAVVALVAPICLLGIRALAHTASQVEMPTDRELSFRPPANVQIIAIRFHGERGDFNSVYFSHHTLELDGLPLRNTFNFKAVPVAEGASLVLHKPRAFAQGHLRVSPESDFQLSGQVELIEPVLGLSNPFRCESLTLFGLRLCT